MGWPSSVFAVTMCSFNPTVTDEDNTASLGFGIFCQVTDGAAVLTSLPCTHVLVLGITGWCGLSVGVGLRPDGLALVTLCGRRNPPGCEMRAPGLSVPRMPPGCHPSRP